MSSLFLTLPILYNSNPASYWQPSWSTQTKIFTGLDPSSDSRPQSPECPGLGVGSGLWEAEGRSQCSPILAQPRCSTGRRGTVAVGLTAGRVPSQRCLCSPRPLTGPSRYVGGGKMTRDGESRRTPRAHLLLYYKPPETQWRERLCSNAQGTAGAAPLCPVASGAGFLWGPLPFRSGHLGRRTPGLAQLGVRTGAPTRGLCVWPGLPHTKHECPKRTRQEPCGPFTQCHFCLILWVKAAI